MPLKQAGALECMLAAPCTLRSSQSSPTAPSVASAPARSTVPLARGLGHTRGARRVLRLPRAAALSHPRPPARGATRTVRALA
eukprot:scaffold5382_cov405-Prasinococcus_capsulatus_cf.AAC.9